MSLNKLTSSTPKSWMVLAPSELVLSGTADSLNAVGEKTADYDLLPQGQNQVASVSGYKAKFTRKTDLNGDIELQITLVPQDRFFQISILKPPEDFDYTIDDLYVHMTGSVGGYETIYFITNIQNLGTDRISMTFNSIGSSNLNLGTTPITILGNIKYKVVPN